MTNALDSAIADGGLLTTAFVRIAGFAEGEIVGREAAPSNWEGDEKGSRALTEAHFKARIIALSQKLNEQGVDAWQEGWMEGWTAGFRAETADLAARNLERTRAAVLAKRAN